MNAMVQTLNTAGRAFVDFAAPMLIQSSVLILILLVLDAVLRKRVRAVFRYWIWMLVLVKLMLPPSLWSPVSVGTWFGDKLEDSTVGLLEHVSRASSPRSEGGTPSTPQGQDALATKTSPIAANLSSRVQRPFVEPAISEPCSPAAPGWGSITPEGGGATSSLVQPPAFSLTWQGLMLLVWAAVVIALLLLLAQRTFFVQGLVAQADQAGGAMLHGLDECRRRLGLRRPISLQLSPNAASPAVCGLWRPVILIPQNLASRLHGTDLQAVLFHELAHVKRGDLWMNLAQTLLQIVYFYHPLLWLANALIRRTREKAVDETVLVAMGEAAQRYPETLVNVAKLAFTRRLALSLRLIGVVESQSALTGRIKHILNRPLPKTARLGILGLVIVLVVAAVLLPMARAKSAATDAREATASTEEQQSTAGKGVGGGALAAPGKPETKPNEDGLRRLLADARPGSVVTIPPGRYTVPLEITQPLTLRGESPEGCIIEVTADQPAVLVNTGGQGQVTLENLTIRWQLATDKKGKLPAAVLVKDTNVLMRNCRFASLGDVRRSPMAVYLDGKSKGAVDNCRFTGFDYVVCYGSGTEGVVQDCLIADCGHQGVIAYDGAMLTVQRNIITGSKFHAVRSTGGTLHVRDNLLIKNAYRGIYLGNRTGRGTITNNLILGNGAGISAFGRADYAIANNVILNNGYAGIDMRDSCRLSIRSNVLGKNQRGLALIKEGTENSNVVGPNVFWANATDAENLEKGAGLITADPQFVDPNHGNFTMRAPARDQGYGLTNPQILKDLWQRYEQLQSEKAKADQSQTPTRGAPVAMTSSPDAGLAWQRTDRYVPPDPNGFFPDDPAAGKSLDTLFQAADKDQRSDDEILSTVQQGFRRASQHRTLILSWIGNRYIWNKDPQHPQAIEIMYHAVPLERHYAIYFGLSVVQNKTPNILRTLANVCVQSPDEVSRITWGLGSQREALLPYLTPYLQDQDATRRQRADVLVQHFKGELDFEQWWRQQREEQTRAQFGDQLPQLRETLRTGTSEARRQTLTTMIRNQIVPILDGSFLPALQAAGTDPDYQVRRDVAIVTGSRWVWSSPRQDPNAIALMLTLAADTHREVRYNAVYYGLSVVRDKSEPVVRRLIQLALADQEGNFYGRIVWGLKSSGQTGHPLFERILAAELEAATADAQRATVRRLHKEVSGQEPPATWPGDQKPMDAPASGGVSGRVIDPNGRPVAGAQVARCTKDKGVDIQAGQLLPTKVGGKGGEIVQTDAEGRFSFGPGPDEFDLVAAHEKGFAWVTNKELPPSGSLRLESWGRIEGTLRIGREVGAGERIGLMRGGNTRAADQNIHFDCETYADRDGRFTFTKVPPTWMEVGYMIRIGDSTSTYTNRTTIHLQPGQNLKMTLGGAGRPVVGRFVPPAGYEGPVYFGQGLRALDTWHPDRPKPANYEQMTKREQQQWYNQWSKTPEARAYYDALWHNLNRRHYSFRIQNDGTFRIEDVVPGKYKFTVWLEERLTGQGRPEEIGAYYGTIEVPAIPGSRTDEPLDLGNLTLSMNKPPLHVGDMAPLFEAKTLDGKDIRLIDYRGRFVLLSFWQPTFHPELDRLKELHKTYGSTGRLEIIDCGGWDTLDEVRKYVAEHQIEWPEIYCDPSDKDSVTSRYGQSVASYILLVNPEGKIVATWLRGEKLTDTVREALGSAPVVGPAAKEQP